MEIYELLTAECCETSLKGRRKEELLEELGRLMRRSSALQDVPLQRIVGALKEREELGSTGFGGGFAIPHCKLSGIAGFVLGVAISPRGIDFEALDNKKVNLFIVIVGPEDRPEGHLKLLAQVSRVLRDERVRRELARAPSNFALLETFLRHTRPTPVTEGMRKPAKLLILVIQEERWLADIFELFLELGIRGASVLESRGIRDILSAVPLFVDFINFLGEHKIYSKTIMATLAEEQVAEVVRGVEEITGDLEKHTGALIAVLDLHLVRGSLEMI